MVGAWHPRNPSIWDCETPIEENLMALVGLYLNPPQLQKTTALLLMATCFLSQNNAKQNKHNLPSLPLTPTSFSLPGQPWSWLTEAVVSPGDITDFHCPSLPGTWADLLSPNLVSFLPHFKKKK